jgi:hypothetical protein
VPGLQILDRERHERRCQPVDEVVGSVRSGVWFRNSREPEGRGFERKEFDPAGGGAHDVLTVEVDADGTRDIAARGTFSLPT